MGTLFRPILFSNKITHYELSNYSKSILEFDKVLKEHPTFSDAQYYKSLCLKYTGNRDDAIKLMDKGKSNNEDSSKYEVYPYQETWQWNMKNIL